MVLVAAGFWGWKYWALSGENTRFELSITNTAERLDSLEPDTATLNSRRNQVAQRAESARTNWSMAMDQVLELENKSVTFAEITIDGKEVKASINTVSWRHLSEFVKELKENAVVDKVRISSVNEINPPMKNFGQRAEITFLFSVTESDEN